MQLRSIPQWRYVSGVSVFFFLFCLIYRPEWMYGYLEMPEYGYLFNVAVISVIHSLCLGLTRMSAGRFPQKFIFSDCLKYSRWCVLELVPATGFVALYLCLISGGSYLSCLGKSAAVLYMTDAFPIAIAALAFAKRKKRTVTFADYSGEGSFTVDADSVLYVAAEENYLRIFYLDGGTPKDIQLRASMKSIGNAASGAGLFRCHKSYFINPSHVNAIRKDRFGNVTAELDCGNVSVKVSRKLQDRLTDLI